MRSGCFRLTLALLVLGSFAATGTSAPADLYSVMYPETSKTSIRFAAQKGAPMADLNAVVEAKKGQSKIRLEFRGMKPAILFGGEISAWVVWAVTPDGTVENLGELWVRDSEGDTQFQTGLRNFAMIVTAEPFPGKRKPGDRVLFVSLPAKAGKGIRNTPFEFSNFGVLGRADNESIAMLEYGGSDPVDLVQARRVYDLAVNFGAAAYNPAKMDEAKVTLAQAENLAHGDRKAMVDFARRTVTLASDAIREAATRKAEEQAAADEARRQAQMSLLKSDADRAAAEAERSSLEAARVGAQLAEVERQRALLARESADLTAQKAALETERDELRSRLEGALGQVATTTATARGLVVNLGDILFDVNKATLKPATQQTVAKLAGILLMVPAMNARIEGHTDSTGREETNLRLSEARAKSVCDLLGLHGIAAERLSFHGYGSASPVADNATKQGRALNRRVEVVIGEGELDR